VVLAANSAAMDKNAMFRFQFMLHADKKSAAKWKDLPIPFPKESVKEAPKDDLGGISQIPASIVVHRPK